MHINSIPDPVGGIWMSDGAVWRNEDADTVLGRAFLGGAAQGGVAAEYAHVQLLNPAASGVVVLIDDLWVSGGTTGVWSLRHYDTPLATKDGDWANNDLGEAAGNGEIRRATDGSLLGDTLMIARVYGNQQVHVSFKRALKLDAGEGVSAILQTVNTSVWASFAGREFTV